MSTIFGKALLVITRLHEDGEDRHFEVSTFIQSCTDGIYDRDAAQEEFGHLEYDVHNLPSAAYKMAWGDTIRVAVTFSISFHRYWDGECDSDLTYHKQRVLRRQKYRPHYQTKPKGCQHLWIGWGGYQACELCNKFINEPKEKDHEEPCNQLHPVRPQLCVGYVDGGSHLEHRQASKGPGQCSYPGSEASGTIRSEDNPFF